MAIENTRQHQVILDAFRNTITALAASIDAKDPYACGHSQRVMEYTIMTGTHFSLSPEEMDTLYNAAVLHDVGKMELDSCILSKPGPLTQAEWEIIHQHPAAGASLLGEITLLEKASELVLYHHERYDGKGYPEGLKGEEIPLGARLIAIAEAFDTMTTGRAYCPAVTIDQALKELQDNAGSQFCPVAVTAFISGLRLHTGGEQQNQGEPYRAGPEF
jgi:HD-GYP domain-containing protein (c-di-GMP phosphodiesterase class II)